MSSRRTGRQPLVALLLGVLVGGGLMAVTPAGAEVSNAVATNWKKIWNKELKPQADQRYYTKKKSNKRYYTKSDSDAKYQPKGNYALNGSSYTKAESDSKYAGAGSAYTKAESDGKYAPYPRRSAAPTSSSDTATQLVMRSAIDLVRRDAAAPRPRSIFILRARPRQPGCTGTAAAPDAAPGNLCIFEASTPTRTRFIVRNVDDAGSDGSATVRSLIMPVRGTGRRPGSAARGLPAVTLATGLSRPRPAPQPESGRG